MLLGLHSISRKYCHLTHWGRVTHICVNKLTIITSDNGLSPGRRQAIIWTNAGILLIGPWGTNFSEILIGIQTFSFKKMNLKMSSAKWRLFSIGLNELNKKVCCRYDLFVLQMSDLEPSSQMIFDRESNSMENLFYCNSIEGYTIITHFYTWNDTTVVVARAKFHRHHFIRTWMTVEWNFLRIPTTMENHSWNGLMISAWSVFACHFPLCTGYLPEYWDADFIVNLIATCAGRKLVVYDIPCSLCEDDAVGIPTQQFSSNKCFVANLLTFTMSTH